LDLRLDRLQTGIDRAIAIAVRAMFQLARREDDGRVRALAGLAALAQRQRR
jgi:hypothetical protein